MRPPESSHEEPQFKHNILASAGPCIALFAPCVADVVRSKENHGKCDVGIVLELLYDGSSAARVDDGQRAFG